MLEHLAPLTLRNQPRSLLDREILRRAAWRQPCSSSTRAAWSRNPVMFVVELGSVLVTILFFVDLGDSSTQENLFAGLVAAWLWFTVALRQLRRGDRRGPRQGAGRRAAQRPAEETVAHRRRADGSLEDVPSSALRVGDDVVGLGRRGDPGRRRGDRGHRERRRVGDHRRVRTRDPRVRRRSLGRHRRHARALRPDRRPHHCRTGRELPRPDDRARRRRRAAEDAERDRAQHPARRADDHLPARGRHAAAVRRLLRRRAERDRARRAARVPDPDDDRRLLSAIGIAGMDRLVRSNVLAIERPRSRGGRRLLDAPARQDRDDHAREPPGDRVPAARRSRRARARRRGAALEPRGRDAGGPLDRRAREGALRAPRARAARRARSYRSPRRRG